MKLLIMLLFPLVLCGQGVQVDTLMADTLVIPVGMEVQLNESTVVQNPEAIINDNFSEHLGMEPGFLAKMNFYTLIGLLLGFIWLLYRIVNKNIDPLKALSERAVSVFGSIQLVQIVMELVMIAYLTPGNFLLNIMRIAPWSLFEYLAASQFVVITAVAATGGFMSLVNSAKSIVLSFIAMFITCYLMFTIWKEAWGFYVMVDSDSGFLGLVFGVALERTDLAYGSGTWVAALNIWSTILISFAAIEFERNKPKPVDKSGDLKGGSKGGSGGGSGKKKPPWTQVGANKGIKVTPETATAIDGHWTGIPGGTRVMDSVMSKLGVQRDGAIYKNAQGRAVKWDNTFSWRRLPDASVTKVTDLFENGHTNLIAKELEDISYEYFKDKVS